MLKHGSRDDIQQMFGQLQREARNIISEIVQLVYFMRGSIQYHDMLQMTYGERDIVKSFIEKRLEDESDKPYPNY